MVCRHGYGDPKCSSFKHQLAEAKDLVSKFNGEPDTNEYKSKLKESKKLVAQHAPEILEPITPDSEKYTIEKIHREGKHLVVKAKYPNCTKCSYEGIKIMVFLNVTETDVIKWRKIDPHFGGARLRATTEAPSPTARFPASAEGWEDAIQYARSKTRKKAPFTPTPGEPYQVDRLNQP